MPTGVKAMSGSKKKSKKTGEKFQDERVVIIHLKGSTEYAEHLNTIHRKSHISRAALFRLAFAEWCERNGYDVPPES